jgi:hypothetical protein
MGVGDEHGVDGCPPDIRLHMLVRLKHRAQMSDCGAIGRQREEMRKPAGGWPKDNPFDVTDLLRDGFSWL